MKPSAAAPAAHAQQSPVAPRLYDRVRALFPPGQFFRYLAVGAFNTAFGYCTYALILKLLSATLPERWLALTVVLASLLSTPLNITVAYFGYKLLVFRTQGNYLREWLKAFAVYGTAMLPGLLALSALTRVLQSLTHPRSRALPGYIAGAIVVALSTIYSFLGHKKFTFRR